MRFLFPLIVLLLFSLGLGDVFADEVNTEAGLKKETFFSLIKKGGIMMIPLAIASIIALALAIERFISLQRDKVLPHGFVDGLGKAWNDDPSGAAALAYCDDNDGAAAHVFKSGIQWRHFGFERVERAIEDTGSREAAKMKRSLRGLKAIAAVSPLLGLMGTVLGMIAAFQRTAQDGRAAKTADLANGIYQALVTTATGLVIAIPTLLIYQFLATRADEIIEHLDVEGTKFVVDYARLDTPQES